MKAAFITDPMKVEVREISIPELPEDGILLSVKACGICGSDLRRWREGPVKNMPQLIAGHEIAGVVLAVGSKVNDYHVGERLAIAPDVHCGKCYYCERGLYNLCNDLNLIGITPGFDGGLSEVMLITSSMLNGGIIHRIPENLSYQEGALAETLSSVLAAHDHAGTTFGDTVLVMGAGPIGCLHIAVAKARGASVILSEPNEGRREMALKFQPDFVFDPMNQSLADEVQKATDGIGVGIAICANPIAATHTQAVELVRKRGKIVLFGGLPKSSPMTSLNGNLIHYNEIQIIGSFSYHPMQHALALKTIAQGIINSEHIITHHFSLDEVSEAFQTAASGEALKVMILFS